MVARVKDLWGVCDAIVTTLRRFERDLISERTKAGLTSARARGRVGGRPKTDTDKLEWAKSLYDAKVKTLDEIKVATGVSKSALYRYIESLKAKSS